MANFHESGNDTIIKRIKIFISRLTRLKVSKVDQIGAFLFVALILSASLLWLFEERFTKEHWQSYPQKRYKMADEIVDNKLLIGKSKQEVILLLGNTVRSLKVDDGEHLIYPLGTPPSFFETKKEKLVIIFEESRVVKVIQSQE